MFIRISVLKLHGSQIKSLLSWSCLDHLFCKCSPFLIKLFGCNTQTPLLRQQLVVVVLSSWALQSSRQQKSSVQQSPVCLTEPGVRNVPSEKVVSFWSDQRSPEPLTYCLRAAHNKCLQKSNKIQQMQSRNCTLCPPTSQCRGTS